MILPPSGLIDVLVKELAADPMVLTELSAA